MPFQYDADLPGYKNMMTMMAGHGGVNMPKAQAIKDATMAYFILQYFVAAAFSSITMAAIIQKIMMALYGTCNKADHHFRL
jgi:hypothetical protein